MEVDPTNRFAALVRGPEADAALDEVAALIAVHARPSLEVADLLKHLDVIAEGVPEPTLDALLDHLYDGLGFHGNRDRYDDPDNSFLDQVLERRTGIPISLAVVLVSVGRRLGLGLAGVGMPGHFLVRTSTETAQIVDPFDGVLLDWSDCEARFHLVQGPAAEFHSSYLAPVGPRMVAARMLMNLKQLYLQAQDAASLEWVLRLRTLIPGVPAHERNELVAVLVARARYDEAADVVESLLEDAPEPEHERLAGKAAALRARLN